MRFNGPSAVTTMDGLYAPASGNPALPPWLARRLLPFFFTERGENDKYRDHIASSAGIAVFSAARNDKAHWVAVGRACQRFALQATALGLKYAFINQPVEVASLRPQFASWLGLGDRRPDLVVPSAWGPICRDRCGGRSERSWRRRRREAAAAARRHGGEFKPGAPVRSHGTAQACRSQSTDCVFAVPFEQPQHHLVRREVDDGEAVLLDRLHLLRPCRDGPAATRRCRGVPTASPAVRARADRPGDAPW